MLVKIYIYMLLISENLESLINVETCILGHVWGVLQLNTSFPDVNFFFIFLVHIILLKMLSGYTLEIAIKLKGYTPTNPNPVPLERHL